MTLSICLCICLYICLFVYLPVSKSVYSCVCLFVHPSICASDSDRRSVYLSVCLSVSLSVPYRFRFSVLFLLSTCKSVFSPITGQSLFQSIPLPLCLY